MCSIDAFISTQIKLIFIIMKDLHFETQYMVTQKWAVSIWKLFLGTNFSVSYLAYEEKRTYL